MHPTITFDHEDLDTFIAVPNEQDGGGGYRNGRFLDFVWHGTSLRVSLKLFRRPAVASIVGL